MPFSTTALNVLLVMVYAIPGFLLVKVKQLNQTQIAPFSKVLIWFCQPMLETYAFHTAKFSLSLLIDMGWFFLICTGVQIIIMLIAVLLFHNSFQDACKRVCSAACSLGNVGFIGIPLLSALLPEESASKGIALAAVFAVSMNFIAWSFGLMLITGNKKYIKIKSLFLNPAILALIVALPLFIFNISLPAGVDNVIALSGKISTPICMIVLGMRLGSTKFSSILRDRHAWIACIGKLIIMPLLAFGIVYFLPFEPYFKTTLFILCSCPVASVVQNFSEIYLEDQSAKECAANSILLSTILCILTIPLLALLANF